MTMNKSLIIGGFISGTFHIILDYSLSLSQCFLKEFNLAFLSVVFDNYTLVQLKTATFRIQITHLSSVLRCYTR